MKETLENKLEEIVEVLECGGVDYVNIETTIRQMSKAIKEIELEYGSFYEEILELEWGMGLLEFIRTFWDCEYECFNI